MGCSLQYAGAVLDINERTLAAANQHQVTPRSRQEGRRIGAAMGRPLQGDRWHLAFGRLPPIHPSKPPNIYYQDGIVFFPNLASPAGLYLSLWYQTTQTYYLQPRLQDLLLQELVWSLPALGHPGGAPRLAPESL